MDKAEIQKLEEKRQARLASLVKYGKTHEATVFCSFAQLVKAFGMPNKNTGKWIINLPGTVSYENTTAGIKFNYWTKKWKEWEIKSPHQAEINARENKGNPTKEAIWTIKSRARHASSYVQQRIDYRKIW